MISYIDIGEETGCLDEVLKSLSEHYDQEIEISENIRSAITYPLIMLAMMGTVIIILLVKVLPVFQQVFRQMGPSFTAVADRITFQSPITCPFAGIFSVFPVLKQSKHTSCLLPSSAHVGSISVFHW